MSDRADELIKLLRTEGDELASLVRGFTADDLARESGAAEWDVSQVLSHLGSGAEINLEGLNGAVNGTGTPSMDFIRGVWARWDGRSRAERAENYPTANAALVSGLESLDEAAKRELRIELWFPAPPQDVAGFAGMRLREFAFHTWDVKAAFDPSATLSPAVVEPLIDLVHVMVGFVGKPEGLGGRQATVAVRLTEPERAFGLDIGEKVSIVDTPAEPDATLTAPAEWWLRLLYGRHSPEHTPASVEFTGGTISLDDLRRVFPGF
ncbi:maleylpyruvate isomerase family mycothiol-dependent enzyme [Thermopolyspora sp. NPDC052614]|uniref:maleylpyruvate isomerase family mycothiol-dependent enzyme n=1 Tax=Thermopolyspora sp. NPDC052614 TaxID=3155682 RepID=UPI0034169465